MSTPVSSLTSLPDWVINEFRCQSMWYCEYCRNRRFVNYQDCIEHEKVHYQQFFVHRMSFLIHYRRMLKEKACRTLQRWYHKHIKCDRGFEMLD